ncbi:NADH-quinone oxidoreductase subunit L [Pseudomonas sp. HK3]
MQISQYIPLMLGMSIPLILLLGMTLSLIAKPNNVWRHAHLTSFIALIASVLLLVLTLIQGPYGAFLDWVNLTNVSAVVLVAVSLIAFVVLRFSENYMAGEPRQQKFAGLLQLTFAGASIVIVSNHLLVLMAAWMTVSLAMHQLLLFYPERPRAALAAHKKFIYARLAELSLFSAFVLLYIQNGTWVISDLMGHYSTTTLALNGQENLAVCLIALAVIIKSAQLPAHGWLIQVVEAPTPISAALHGGVINMGGFMLISFAPLFGLSSMAQWLVLVVAGLSTLIAALVMTTRVSVKVRLAWSTSAQIGLMLIECALGLYELALLHLVAHSFYKAHAFLNAGNAITYHMMARSAIECPPRISQWLSSLVAAAIIVGGSAYVATSVFNIFDGIVSPWLLLGLALVMLLAQRSSTHTAINFVPHMLLAAVIVGLYITLKSASHTLLQPSQHTYNVWADAWVSLLFVALFIGSYLQRYQLHRLWVQKFNLVLFAGLYIDEWSTRTTLAIWPKLLPVRMNAKKMKPVNKESLL